MFTSVLSLLRRTFVRHTKEDALLTGAILSIAGLRPSNLSLYRLALSHDSKTNKSGNVTDSNERLELLGDAILGAAVTDYLFGKYPRKNEGFLTEIRSRIVSRESLNAVARKMGIAQIIRSDLSDASMPDRALGDALEAIVGAVYLDKGYDRCRLFVVEKLLRLHFDLDEMTNSTLNYKSRIIEWAQRNRKRIYFQIEEYTGNLPSKEFAANVFIDDRPYGKGFGHTKKKATQNASRETCALLGID